MNKRIDIAIAYPDYFPENFGEVITSDIQHEKLHLLLKREETKAWSSLEWAIPGLIAVYILKPYFEAFLEEAGKDHYNLLKQSLSKLLKLNKNAPIETVVSKSTPKKLNKENTQSKAISIHIEIKDERTIKLLFDNELELDDWTKALENILDTVQKNYLESPNDELTLALNPLKEDPRIEIFAKINKDTKEWEFLDLRTIGEIEFNKQKRDKS